MLPAPGPMADTMSTVMRLRRLDSVGLACGVPAALLGILTILGWFFRLPGLGEILPAPRR